MSCGNNELLVRHLCKFIGEMVTIFTTSGGMSGSGFTGVLLSVNHRFVRLLTHMGEPPACPLSNSSCANSGNGCMPGLGGSFTMPDSDGLLGNHHVKEPKNRVGSVCDIPIDRIAAFCHNTV